MAWALLFDGVNDSAATATEIDETSTSWRAEFSAQNLNAQSSFPRFLGSVSGSQDYMILRYTGGRDDVNLKSRNGTEMVLQGSARVTNDGFFHDYIVTCDGVNLTLDIDAGTVTDTIVGSIPFPKIGSFGKSGSVHFNGGMGYFRLYDDPVAGTKLFDYDATPSNHGAGTPVLEESVVNNDATGVNMPTDGSAWLDLGGSGITVTGATANYNYSGVIATVDLTGEIIVTGATANYDYSGIQGTVTLDSEIIVTGQTANYNYTGVDGVVELTGSITVTGQTANYDYTGIAADITLQGSIIVTGSTANYDYNGLNATIIIQGPITLNPKNTIRVARKSNATRVKRKSNTIRVG